MQHQKISGGSQTLYLFKYEVLQTVVLMHDIRVVNESAHDTRRYTPYSIWNLILAVYCCPALYHLRVFLQKPWQIPETLHHGC